MSFAFHFTPLKLVICFVLALVTTVIVRFAIGAKRDLWFARTHSSVINQRGALGYHLSLGYPVTKQGFAVLIGLVLLIALEIALVLFLNF